jgi:hypothetical protein
VAAVAAATAMLVAKRASSRRRAQPDSIMTTPPCHRAQPDSTMTTPPRHLAPTRPQVDAPAPTRPPVEAVAPTARTPVDAPAAGPEPAGALPPEPAGEPATPPAPAGRDVARADEAEQAAIGEAGLHQPPTVGAVPPRHLAQRSGRGRALVGVLVAAGLVVLLGAGAMVVAGAGSGETGTASPTPGREAATTEAPTTTTTTMPASPEDAFAGAASRLEAAGTFAYRGTVSASDVSAVRPSLWLAVDVTVEGEASLAGGLVHEVAVAGNGRATETVVVGVDVWGRSARTRAALADAGYEGIPELSRPEPATKGAAGLAGWLAAVEEPQPAGVDAQGRRQYRGRLPAAALGPTERERRAVDAEVVLILDRAGRPAHVDITTVPGGPPLHLAFDLTDLGAPVAIEPPEPPG